MHESFFFFFFNDTATTEIYTLSLHDALPIYRGKLSSRAGALRGRSGRLADAARQRQRAAGSGKGYAGVARVTSRLREKGCRQGPRHAFPREIGRAHV